MMDSIGIKIILLKISLNNYDRNKLIRMLSEGWYNSKNSPSGLLIKEFIKCTTIILE